MAIDAIRAGAAKVAPPVTLGVAETRERLASGALSASDLAEACIARIEARESEVGAWAFFDADFVRQQARILDEMRKTGRPLGPLHGIPVGIKDIIDTKQIPTENGCAFDKGRVPLEDAFVVKRLKQAGAIIMGKTTTTELAFMHPSATRNPHDPSHTPGGSSAGSAAAVGDGMVPLAIGTQTGGSVIRPASYCGVTGFKPTFGAIPRTGVLMQSPTLDTLGVFAADPKGAAILAEVLFGQDDGDVDTQLAPKPALCDVAGSSPPLEPVFAFIRPPGWETADDQMKAAMEELAVALGGNAFWVELPPQFNEAAKQRRIINFAEMARYYFRYARDGMDQLGPETRQALEEGQSIIARDYIAALDWPKVLNSVLGEIFGRCDAIVSPAAPGPAPAGLETTGDPVFNGLWTLCGTPAVTVPILGSENGLPMGVQLVGARGNDARLLRTANWLYNWADSGPEQEM